MSSFKIKLILSLMTLNKLLVPFFPIDCSLRELLRLFHQSLEELNWKGTLQSSLPEIAFPQEIANLDVARYGQFPMWNPLLVNISI
jgi:hypothetical protein